MKRKIFASVISVVLTFCMVFPCGAANAASNGKGGENLVMEYTLLAKSGIIDYYDTDSAWDDVRMKRIDIINAAANMTGYNPQFPYETSLPYTDIVPGYEQLNVIRFAYATELINGSQKLAPEKTLDFQFAIEVLTNACGYGSVARAKNNYRSTKAYSKLAAGVKSSDYVSMNDFVRLLYNVFDVDYMERVSYGSGGYGYETRPGISAPGYFLDLYTVRGRINSTPVSSVTGTRSAADTIIVDTAVYHYEDASLICLIGRTVEGIYRQDGEFRRLICAYADDDSSTVIDADRVISANGGVLKYETESGRTRSADIRSGVIIYNGQEISGSSYDRSLFNIKDGSVTLIGTGSRYDAVVIDSRENLLVGAVDNDNGVLSFYDSLIDGKKLSVNTDAHGYISVTAADGSEGKLTDIKSGTLITYCASLDGSVVRIFSSARKVSGKLTSDEEKGGLHYIGIDGNEYKVTGAVKAGFVFKVGTVYTAYINVYGNVGAIDYNAPEDKIGYLITYSRGSGMKDENTIRFRLLTNDDDDYVDYYGSDRITVDGVSGLDAKDTDDAMMKYMTDIGKTTFSPYAVAYATDDSGRICRIDTPHREPGESDNSLVRRYSLDDAAVMVKRIENYKMYSVAQRFYIHDSALRVGFDSTSPDEYFTTNYTGDAATMNIELYSLGTDTQKCVASVASSAAKADSFADNMALVLNVRRGINDREEIVKKYTLMYEGNKVTYEIKQSDEANIGDYVPGDVVLVTLDARNRITQIGSVVNWRNTDVPIFHAADAVKGTRYNGSQSIGTAVNAKSRYVTGTVYDVEYDADTGRYVVSYFTDDPNTLSYSMLPENTYGNYTYMYSLGRDSAVDCKLLEPSDAPSKLKCYRQFGDDADVIIVRYTYFSSSYSYIYQR